MFTDDNIIENFLCESVVVGRRRVCYDRWGFCTVYNSKLDQAGIAEAARYLAGRKI
jgi:hypothetical protein